jgi:hypothetical protein
MCQKIRDIRKDSLSPMYTLRSAFSLPFSFPFHFHLKSSSTGDFMDISRYLLKLIRFVVLLGVLPTR